MLEMHAMQTLVHDKTEKHTFWLPPGEPGSVHLSHSLAGGKTYCKMKHLFGGHKWTPVYCHSASADIRTIIYSIWSTTI